MALRLICAGKCVPVPLHTQPQLKSLVLQDRLFPAEYPETAADLYHLAERISGEAKTALAKKSLRRVIRASVSQNRSDMFTARISNRESRHHTEFNGA